MKRLLVFIVSLVLWSTVLCQVKVPNGIYATYSAFYQSQPLPTYSVQLKKKSDSAKFSLGQKQFILTPKLRLINNRVYGLSDGMNFYISSSLYDPQGPLRFSKLLYRGDRVGVFFASLSFLSQGQRASGFTVVDLKKGNFFPLTKTVTLRIIETNKPLYNQLKAHRNPSKEDLVDYLRKYESE